jgi:streptogramin lyase
LTCTLAFLPLACDTDETPAGPASSSSAAPRRHDELVPDHATAVRVDAESGSVDAVLSTGGDPFFLAVASDQVWIQSFEDGTLTRIDPLTSTASRVDVGEVVGIASDGDDLWVARDGDVLARLDGATGEQETALRLPGGPLFAPRDAGFVAAGGGSLWLTVPPRKGRAEELWRIDPRGGDVLATIPLGGDATPPFAGRRYLWVVTTADQALTRIDMRTNESVAVAVDSFPWSVVEEGGSLWVSHRVDPRVVRLDRSTLHVSAELPFETNPRGLTFGGGRIWVATEDGLYAIDPATNAVTRTLAVGPFPVDTGPIGIAYLAGSVWISIE